MGATCLPQAAAGYLLEHLQVIQDLHHVQLYMYAQLWNLSQVSSANCGQYVNWMACSF